MSRRQALRRAVAAAASAALVGFGRLNTSASLPRGLYAEVPSAWMGRPARGDLVVACPPPAAAELARRRAYLADGPCAARAAGGAAPLGKVVLAVAGDEVMVAAAGLAVNGRAVPASRLVPRDAAGRPLPHPAFGGCRVRPGELWLFAPYHPRSYDSRYFGPVATAAIRGRLLPLAVANDDRFAGFQLHRFHLSMLPAAPR
jgi:conjugative transfer signal peptidase TraF